MNLSELTLKLLLLFVPGIICSCFIDTFTNHKERTKFEFVINSYLYGLLSYGLYWGIVKIFWCSSNIPDNDLVFLKALVEKDAKINFREIAYACMIAVVVAIVFTYIHTHKLHFKFFQFIGITKKFGELDVWGFMMNSKDVTWVTVRDIENNLMYDGWVRAFSDNSKEAEILLEDVKVYSNDSGALLYDVESQYLSLDRPKIVIEMRG